MNIPTTGGNKLFYLPLLLTNQYTLGQGLYNLSSESGSVPASVY